MFTLIGLFNLILGLQKKIAIVHVLWLPVQVWVLVRLCGDFVVIAQGFLFLFFLR